MRADFASADHPTAWETVRNAFVNNARTWDDEEQARFATPSMSTVAVDREAQGRDAIHRLLAEIHGEPPPEPSDRTINRVIYRESTAPPPHR